MPSNPSASARVIVLALLFSFALPARADNTADEADLRFRRGVTAWSAGRYEEALGEFFQSNRLVPNLNVLLNIARCYEQLKRWDEAYRYYADVLDERPSASDRAAIVESLTRLAPKVALLRVESDPPGAEIFIDRKDLGARGTTPRTLALPPGPMLVLLEKQGYRQVNDAAELVTGKTATLRLALPFVTGRVRLEGSPAAAEVRVDTTDGEPAGAVPGTLALAPGKHILNVSAPKYLPMQLPVDVRADAEERVSVTLQRLPDPTGNVIVTANHEDATVRVDGRDVGTTPAFLPLPVGRHTIEVSREEMHPVTQVVDVTANGRSEVKAELLYAGARTTAASRTEATVDEVPASITVISREEILAFGFTTLAEALRGVRGMFLSRDRSYEYLGVRGFSPPGDYNHRILVLYDGHPMNELFTGQAFIGRENNVDLAEVERIEVVRGPVSSLFGSSAFFGVINVVPRASLGARRAEAGLVTGSSGLSLGRVTAGHEGADTELLLSVAGAREVEDGLYVGPVDEKEPLVRGRASEKAVNATARARWRSFTLLGSVNDRTRSYEWLTRVAQDPTTRFAREKADGRAFVEGRWAYDAGGGAGLLARATFDASRYDGGVAYDDGSMARVHAAAEWAGLELRWRTREFLSQRVTASFEFQRQLRILQQNHEAEKNGPMKLQLDHAHSASVVSAWVADELRLGRVLLVNASVRADYYADTAFGLTLNPRLAIISRAIPGGITKLMGGTSFRAPTAFERFYSDPVRDPATGLPTGGYVSARPSPDLAPETVATGELEHSQEVGRDVRLTGSVFVNRLGSLIYEQRGEDDLLVSTNAAGTVRTQGAELELRWKPSRWGLVTASAWFQRLVAEDLDAEQAARLRTNIPPYAFSLRAIAPLQPPLLVASAEAVYNAPRPTSDGTTDGEVRYVAIALSGELPARALRYSIAARNLLPDRAPQPLSIVDWGAQPAGISLLAQVSATF